MWGAAREAGRTLSLDVARVYPARVEPSRPIGVLAPAWREEIDGAAERWNHRALGDVLSGRRQA